MENIPFLLCVPQIAAMGPNNVMCSVTSLVQKIVLDQEHDLIFEVSLILSPSVKRAQGQVRVYIDPKFLDPLWTLV